MVPSWCRRTAHCATKAISATVATDRPTMTLDSQVSNRQIRCTSARGRNDLKAQPKTYAAQNSSIIPMPDALPAAPAGCSGSSRYSTNQTAILTPLTSVSRPHHQDTGLDQAREPDRACHSKLIRRSAVIELTSDCSNTVTDGCRSRQKCVWGNGAIWGQGDCERAGCSTTRLLEPRLNASAGREDLDIPVNAAAARTGQSSCCGRLRPAIFRHP